MITDTIQIKPLSVNEAWQGRRYKTDKYKAYEIFLHLRLPFMLLPQPPFKLTLEFGFSNKASDFDNGIKIFVDILQKKYGFNDKDIYEALIRKKIVPKGKEYVSFSLEHFNPQQP